MPRGDPALRRSTHSGAALAPGRRAVRRYHRYRYRRRQADRPEFRLLAVVGIRETRKETREPKRPNPCTV